MLIDVVVYDGLDEMDALGPLEALRSAAEAGGDLTARLVTRERQDVVVGSYGLRFVPDAAYGPGADVLVVTGGGWAARAEAGAWGEVQRGQWLPLLAAARDTTRVLAGVCTGTMLLAHAGVVGTRRVATHHTAWDDLAATGATVVPDRVVDDGNLVTSGGVTSGIDLALGSWSGSARQSSRTRWRAAWSTRGRDRSRAADVPTAPSVSPSSSARAVPTACSYSSWRPTARRPSAASALST